MADYRQRLADEDRAEVRRQDRERKRANGNGITANRTDKPLQQPEPLWPLTPSESS